MHLLSTISTVASVSSNEGAALGGVMLLVVGLFYAAIIAGVIWLYATIVRKAGYSGWYVLMMFVPIANIVFLILFAVKEWPIEARVRELEHYTGARRVQ